MSKNRKYFDSFAFIGSMKIFFLKCIVFFSLIISVTNGYAQKFTKNKRYWSIGGSLNAMNYAGDMDPGTFFINPALGFTRWNIGACVLYRYTSRISFRGAFAYGRIQGDDHVSQKPDISNEHASGWRYIRGTNFTNDIFELKADMVFDFIQNRGKYNKRVDWTPYGFVGLAYFFMTPKATYDGNTRLIKDVLPPGQSFSSHQLAIPVGVGVRFKIAKLLDLAVELGLRKTFTGYLDGVKGSYSNPATMSKEQQTFDNPSMVRYGKDADVTRVINQQGIEVHDIAGNVVVVQANNSTQDLVGNAAYATPVGFGHTGDKKAEYQADWYIVFGFHLTYILPERVQCPKFRD
jgi:hypothetical protein